MTRLTPNQAGDAHPACSPQLSQAEQLGETVDQARQLLVDLGMRPYRVHVVRVRWSGGEVGKGKASTVEEMELLPTPLVDLRPVRSEYKRGGKAGRGNITLREVSPRYTEDQIRGLFHVKPRCGDQVFVEVQHDSRDPNAERRRYGVTGVPWRDAENFQWVVTLSSEDAARTREGAIDQPKLHPGRRPL